jgi:hypothetical protein
LQGGHQLYEIYVRRFAQHCVEGELEASACYALLEALGVVAARPVTSAGVVFDPVSA